MCMFYMTHFAKRSLKSKASRYEAKVAMGLNLTPLTSNRDIYYEGCKYKKYLIGILNKSDEHGFFTVKNQS